ncbi:unnamed protein product [Auanema sp. JU1783]|nr:unnamed protein product [Auanema sp. JU1783]
MNYEDKWREFLSLVSESKKGFFKKPDYEKILNQMMELSRIFEEDEVEENAAAIHVEMSSIYNTLNKHAMKEKHLIAAAEALARHMEKKKRTMSNYESHFKQDAFGFYNAAIKSAVSTNSRLMAGSYALQAGDRFKEMGEYSFSERFYRKAYAFYAGNSNLQLGILWNMLEITIKQRAVHNLLKTIDNIWLFIMKDRTNPLDSTEHLQICEMITVLTLTRLHGKIRLNGRHRALLELYEIDIPELAMKKTKDSEKEKTTLSGPEYSLFTKLVTAAWLVDKHEVGELLGDRDYQFVPTIVREVSLLLLSDETRIP